MQPIVMHLDMNSYFASVEQQDNLEWRGKPLGVCEHLGGIIIAASVEAKKWGIKTGTPVWEAKKLYPKIILTPTRPDRYRFYNRRMVKLVSDYSADVEVYSIDEVFVDLTKACNIRLMIKDSRLKNSAEILNPKSEILNLPMADPFEEAAKIAREIKRRFKTEVGDWVRCSIGIAENKLLAKIASDMQKPNGLIIILPMDFCRPGSRGAPAISTSSRRPERSRMDDTTKELIISKEDLYCRLKLIDIPGIGRRQERNLNRLGIKTLKDLRNYPKSHLVSRFGNIMGHHLYNLGQLKASWKATVHEEREIKSMGHMYTLPREFRKPEFFLPVLYKLCEMVGRRLRRKGLAGNVIHIYAHDKNYEGVGKSIKLGDFIQDGREIFLQAANIHKDLLRGRAFGSLEFKLIGVTVAGLKPYLNQLSLFGEVERNTRLVKALDKINDKYGEFTILRAQMLPAGKAFNDSIGFGRVKELGGNFMTKN